MVAALQRQFRLHLHHPRGWTGRLLFTHAVDRLFRFAGLFSRRIDDGGLQRSVALLVGAALVAGGWPFAQAWLRQGGSGLAGGRCCRPHRWRWRCGRCCWPPPGRWC